MDKIDKLERLAKAATPRPWKIGKGYAAKFVMTYEDIPVRRLVSVTEGNEGTCDLARGWDESCANAAYIVAACNAAPELIARVRELERQRELLARNLAEAPWCLACQIKICSNVGKNIDPLLVDRNECKNVLIRWVEQAAKEAGE